MTTSKAQPPKDRREPAIHSSLRQEEAKQVVLGEIEFVKQMQLIANPDDQASLFSSQFPAEGD